VGYRFDVKWLNNDFHVEANVDKCPYLNEKARTYLKGLHRRHNLFVNKKEEYPLRPSAGDRAALKKAYCMTVSIYCDCYYTVLFQVGLAKLRSLLKISRNQMVTMIINLST